MTDHPSDHSSATLTLPPKLRLLPSASYASIDLDDQNEDRLQLAVREQLLRAKQLLMQLKSLGQTPDTPGLQHNLALLRLTMRSLEMDDLTSQHIRDVRTVLDDVTRHLNQRSAERRVENAWHEQRSVLSEWFEAAISKDAWPLDEVRDLAQQLHREFLFQAPPLHWHQASPEDPYLWAASHGLNTAQVLQRMLHPQRHTSRHILNAILAGLLHDLGMTRLPVRVLCALEQTNPTTKQQWRSHATWLAERLRPHLHPEEFDVAQAIAEHHERLDGSGYPQQLKGMELIELGRQLAVADAYAALCQPRPHRPAYTTRQAVRLILQEARQGRFDELVTLLLLPWARLPAGSSVELSDGSQGKVIAWHPHQLGQPVVTIESQNRVIDLEMTRDRQVV
jgi:HD-GYP domain-containing protein (c-di-GMP phosphodiesterase class II)